jgi:hypothetical protein
MTMKIAAIPTTSRNRESSLFLTDPALSVVFCSMIIYSLTGKFNTNALPVLIVPY